MIRPEFCAIGISHATAASGNGTKRFWRDSDPLTTSTIFSFKLIADQSRPRISTERRPQNPPSTMAGSTLGVECVRRAWNSCGFKMGVGWYASFLLIGNGFICLEFNIIFASWVHLFSASSRRCRIVRFFLRSASTAEIRAVC